MRCLTESDPSNASWQRDLSLSHERMGDVLRQQGDLAGALVAYQEALQLRQRLDQDSTRMDCRHPCMSLADLRLRNVLRQQGDLAGALVAYQEALQLRQPLTE